MISFSVRMTFNADDKTEVGEALVALTRATRQEPGCLSYIPHWVEGESATLFLYEQYVSEAAIEQHRSSTHFAVYATGVLYQKMLSRAFEHLQAIA